MASDPGFLNYLERLNDAKGLPKGYLQTVYQIESSGGTKLNNPLNPNVHGPFQFKPETAASVGLKNPNDPYEAASGAATYALRNRDTMAQILHRDPSTFTGPELYLAHQQGGNGAAGILADPNGVAGATVGNKQVENNGGNPAAPNSAFRDMWFNKYNNISTAMNPAPSQNQSGGIGADINARPPPSMPATTVTGQPPPPTAIPQSVTDFINSPPMQTGQSSLGQSMGIMRAGMPASSSSQDSPFPPMQAEPEHMPDLSLMALLQRRRTLMPQPAMTPPGNY